MFVRISYGFLLLVIPLSHTKQIIDDRFEEDYHADRQFGRSARHLLQNSTQEYSWMIGGCNPQFFDCSEQSNETNADVDEVDPWTHVYVQVRNTASEGCTDKEPDKAMFTCSQFRNLGLCYAVDSQYCRKTCKRCLQLSLEDFCQDVLFEGLDSCSIFVEKNLCEAPTIKGKYCARSCGLCPDECESAEALHCDLDALLAFKNSVSGIDTEFSSWEGTNPCGWEHIDCVSVDGTNQRVSKVDFGYNLDKDETSASLVPEFSKMRYVREFVVSDLNVTGQLLDEYSVLDKLTKFDIYKLALTGTLPSAFSTWSNIQYFSSSFNYIESNLPTEWSHWKKLEKLILTDNKLSGTLSEEFSAWTELLSIEVNDNQLSGTLPTTFSNWHKAERVQVYGNEFSGTLPLQYSTMVSMIAFLASENLFTSVLAPEWSAWLYCRDFRASNCDLSGALPPEYSTMVQLTRFIVRQNKFSNTLPAEYSTWKSCDQFRVSDNRFNGTLPVEYSAMPKMRQFVISLNENLVGTLPPEYTTMELLKEFLAGTTGLDSFIPPEWSIFSASVQIEV